LYEQLPGFALSILSQAAISSSILTALADVDQIPVIAPKTMVVVRTKTSLRVMSNSPSEFTRMIEPGRAAQSQKFYITDDPQTIFVLTCASHLSEVAVINSKIT
jgi:hypothetical protein